MAEKGVPVLQGGSPDLAEDMENSAPKNANLEYSDSLENANLENSNS